MLSPLSCSSFLGRPWRFRWIFIFSGGRWWPAVAGGRRRGAAATVNTLFFTFFFALPLIVLFALVYQLRNHKIEPQLTRSTKNTTQKNKQKRLPFLSLFESRRGCDSGVVETYGLGCNVLFSSFVLIAVLCVCVVIVQVFVNFSVPFCLCLWSDPFSGCFLQVDLWTGFCAMKIGYEVVRFCPFFYVLCRLFIVPGFLLGFVERCREICTLNWIGRSIFVPEFVLQTRPIRIEPWHTVTWIGTKKNR